MSGFMKYMYIGLTVAILMNEIVASLDAGKGFVRAAADGIIYAAIFTVIYLVINERAEDE